MRNEQLHSPKQLTIFFQKRETFKPLHYQAGACTTLVLQPLFFRPGKHKQRLILLLGHSA